MNEEQLYESMNGIDEETLETSETAKPSNRWKKIAVLAACFCLVVTAVIWTMLRGDGDFYYNDAVVESSGVDMMLPGEYFDKIYTKKPLTETEMNALLPNKRTEWMEFTDSWATFNFNEKGEILEANLHNYDPEVANSVYVTFSHWMQDNLRATDGKAEPSRYRGVEFYIYQRKSEYRHQEVMILTAVTHIRGVWIELEVNVPDENLDEAKVHFEEMLKCFAHYGWNKPNLKKLSFGYVPEYIDEKLTYEQATQDRDFGKYIPKTIPEGFVLQRCDREKNSRQNVLNIDWKNNFTQIDWSVSYYDPEHSYSDNIIDADKLRPDALAFQKDKYSNDYWIYVRFDDVVVYVNADGAYKHILARELIKIRDSLQ